MRAGGWGGVGSLRAQQGVYEEDRSAKGFSAIVEGSLVAKLTPGSQGATEAEFSGNQ